MSEAAASARDAVLAQRLGPLGLAATVFNTVVGAGIYVVPATLARSAGGAAPFAYLACIVVMAAVSLCFAAAGSRTPTSGGPYGYAGAAFGPFMGFLVGVFLWLSAVLAAAGIAAAIADALGGLAPALRGAGPRTALLLLLFGALAAVNCAGVTRGSSLVGVMTVVKLAPLLLLIAVALPHLHPAYLAPGRTLGSGFGRAMILALFAFQGMETAVGVSGEVRNPARNVPLGLLGAMAAVGVLYIGVQVAAQGVLGPALGGQALPLAAAVGRIAPGLAWAMALGGGLSMFGYLASDALATPRLLFAFARDRLAPPWLASVGPRTRAPYAAVLAHLGLAFALAAVGGFTELVVLSSLVVTLVYLIACAAAVVLQHRGVETAGPPLRVPGLWAAALVGAAGMAFLLSNARPVEIAGGLAITGAIAAWYGAARALGKRSAMAPTAP
jgi:APA family basic amino acid/polyamine antiporter